MKRTNLSWAWRPDSKTELALKAGSRKVRGLPLGSDKPHFGGLIETTKPNVHKEKRIMATKNTQSKKRTVAPVETAKMVTGIPLKKICSELKMEPRLARRKLRNSGLDFHGSRERWTFTKAQVPKVKAILQPSA